MGTKANDPNPSVARLLALADLLSREPCQHSEDGEYRCSDDLTLEQEERCLPCMARVEWDALAFRATRP